MKCNNSAIILNTVIRVIRVTASGVEGLPEHAGEGMEAPVRWWR